MARALAALLVVCLLQSGALGASLRAGGITAAERSPTAPPAAAQQQQPQQPQRAPAGDVAAYGKWLVLPRGALLAGSRVVDGQQQLLVVMASPEQAVSFSSGAAYIAQPEQPQAAKGAAAPAAPARRQLAEDARISTLGGSTYAFDSDGMPLTHKDGAFTTSRGVVETMGGTTSAFDDMGNPLTHRGGYFVSEPNAPRGGFGGGRGLGGGRGGW